MQNLAPIVLFTYNRPRHTWETIRHLLDNQLATESILYIYSDGPKSKQDMLKVRQVRNILTDLKGFKEVVIVEKDRNKGLAESITEGVSEVLLIHRKAIVLEDDLVTSPYFLKYMNEGLEMYENDNEVASIHGYCYPVKESLPRTFFIRGADCWGWGTWERAWRNYESDGNCLLEKLIGSGMDREFNFNNSYAYTKMLKKQVKGQIDSWAIRWYASCFLAGMYTLYTYPSLVLNIGHDNSGTHTGYSNLWGDTYSRIPFKLSRIPIEECQEARIAFERFFINMNKPQAILRRAFEKLRHWPG